MLITLFFVCYSHDWYIHIFCLFFFMIADMPKAIGFGKNIVLFESNQENNLVYCYNTGIFIYRYFKGYKAPILQLNKRVNLLLSLACGQ